MIKTTVGAALRREVEGYSVNGLLQGYTLYLVRDETVVLYIGQSPSPLERLQQHIGATWRSDYSILGDLIQTHKPESYIWTYELWKPEECLEFLREQWTESVPTLVDWFIKAFLEDKDRDDAEMALIHHFKPCLNRRGNPYPTPLPEKYRRKPFTF